MIMKKKAAIFATVVLFISLALSSCKSVQDCPAYDSQVEMETEGKQS